MHGNVSEWCWDWRVGAYLRRKRKYEQSQGIGFWLPLRITRTLCECCKNLARG
ncbi:MAG: hypothetical protein FWB77_04625 [Treponema sp.]|nr:hypothetical protein [Treponema sp.]